MCKIVGGGRGQKAGGGDWKDPKAGGRWHPAEGGGQRVTHTETAEEVRKDWEVGEFSFSLFFSQRISHTRQRPSERTTVHALLNKYQ